MAQMGSDHEEEVLMEIARLHEEDASWIEFCALHCHIAQYEFQQNDQQRDANRYRGYGKYLVENVLNQRSGNDCLQLTRMRPPAFRNLVWCLKHHYGFEDSRKIAAEERLALSLFVLGHSAGLRVAHLLFCHSTSTIHAHFHYVLAKLERLSADMIKPHPQYLHGHGDHVSPNPRHSPFQNCIGAIDGPHIPAVPPEGESERYRNRHGELTQNVLAVVDFNMCFTFVAAGWEGSTHDSRMLNAAMENPSSNFPAPALGKYYLVDSGFANRSGFLSPYKGRNTRYHMQEFQRATSSHARQPRNSQERFNYLHSSCRNIVERSFGVLKKCFLILQRMPEYGFRYQQSIVLATMAVHNYLRKVDMQDPGFVAAMRPDYTPMEPNISPDEDDANGAGRARHDRREWEIFRETITRRICES